VLTISIVAVFINSALVIIAGAAFYQSEGFTDLYGLFDLFKTRISNTAALLFALSMLFSGISSGIVSTMAGQTVMEAALNIRLHPFWRRLLTRCVAIVPALIVATTVGPTGLAQALVMCNYILAVGLIFVTLPMVWYVTHEKYMLVPDDDGTGTVSMVEGFWGTVFAWITWTIVILMNIATIILLALGLSDD
jgi:metal iron transporter